MTPPGFFPRFGSGHGGYGARSVAGGPTMTCSASLPDTSPSLKTSSVGKGHAPNDAARLARAAAGGRIQALEALREQRGLPWLDSSWLDVKLGLRLLVRNWGLTLVGGLAMSVAIGIAAVVFAAFDVLMWSPLPLEEGDRIVAIQMWDREAGQRRDTPWQDIERWRGSLQSVDDVGAFQTIRRNVITADGSVELVAVAEISAAGFRVARVPPLIGRVIVDADLAPGAAPVIVIGHDVWQRRFAGARDVIGRELRLGETVHTVVGVMPDGFQFPLNFRYWVPLQPGADEMLRNTGPEGVVFGRLAPDATLARAHAEVSALGILPPALRSAQREGGPNAEATGARVVPYTFAFTGDFEPRRVGPALVAVQPRTRIAAAAALREHRDPELRAHRHAAAGVRRPPRPRRQPRADRLAALHRVARADGRGRRCRPADPARCVGRGGRAPAADPRWPAVLDDLRRFVPHPSLRRRTGRGWGRRVRPRAGAPGHGAPGAARRRRARRTDQPAAGRHVDHAGDRAGRLLGRRAAAGRRTRLGHAADRRRRPGLRRRGVCDRTCRAGRGPVRSSMRTEDAPRSLAIASASWRDGFWPTRASSAWRPPCGRPARNPGCSSTSRAATCRPRSLNGRLPGFPARFNQVDTSFFDIYQVPGLAGRRFNEGDVAAEADAVIVNRNFADTIAPGGNALGRRFRYVRAMDGEWLHGPEADRWYEVVGVVGNLPVTTDARVAYHAAAPGQIHPAHLQLRLRGGPAGLAERLRDVAASVDPTLHVDEVRTLAEIYREHRFGDNLGAITIGAVTGSVLLLSAAGLYALMAFTVAQRRREIGIRSALGAQPGQLVAAVFRRAFWQIGAGSAVGMLAAYLVGRYVPIEQIGGLPIPGVLPGAAAFMLLVGVLASLGPARRGLRIDPTEALRSE